jgi:hypothetical protein
MKWSVKRAEADIAELKEQRKNHELAIAHIDEEIEQIRIFISILPRYESTRRIAEAEKFSGSISSLENNKKPNINTWSNIDERFRTKSLSDAATLLLDIEQKPMTCKQITDGLLEKGIPFAASKPEQSVYSALKAAQDHTKVKKVARGLWASVPPEERVKVGIAISPKPPNHGEKTRLGLAAAKERGVQLGTRERLTLDQVELARTMIANGATIVATAQAVGMSKLGLTKWMKRHSIQRPLTSRKSEADEANDPSVFVRPS